MLSRKGWWWEEVKERTRRSKIIRIVWVLGRARRSDRSGDRARKQASRLNGSARAAMGTTAVTKPGLQTSKVITRNNDGLSADVIGSSRAL